MQCSCRTAGSESTSVTVLVGYGVGVTKIVTDFNSEVRVNVIPEDGSDKSWRFCWLW